MSKRPVSARSHAPLALAFAAHFACYLKWRACSLATGQRVPNSDSILVTVLTTRKQAPIKMALNLTSKSKGTEQNKILINSYSAYWRGPTERGWRSSPEPCMFAVKIERSMHDQCVYWCTGKWQVCCLVRQDIGLMMKGRLLTATLVSQKKKTGTGQAGEGYRGGFFPPTLWPLELYTDGSNLRTNNWYCWN